MYNTGKAMSKGYNIDIGIYLKEQMNIEQYLKLKVGLTEVGKREGVSYIR